MTDILRESLEIKQKEMGMCYMLLLHITAPYSVSNARLSDKDGQDRGALKELISLFTELWCW